MTATVFLLAARSGAEPLPAFTLFVCQARRVGCRKCGKGIGHEQSFAPDETGGGIYMTRSFAVFLPDADRFLELASKVLFVQRALSRWSSIPTAGAVGGADFHARDYLKLSSERAGPNVVYRIL